MKDIADVREINGELIFYIARHAFTSPVTLSNGVPILEVFPKSLTLKISKQLSIMPKFRI
jgi:hypothetical protein